MFFFAQNLNTVKISSCADVYPGETLGVDLGVDSNFVSSTANFFFKSFMWTTRQKSLFIHCYATVCSEDDQKCKKEVLSHVSIYQLNIQVLL